MYVYLGFILSFGKERQQYKITKRLQLEWAAFGKLYDILELVDISQSLKTNVSCPL